MKLVPIFALAAATVLCASHYASAATCSRPAKLAIPDGKTASDEAMKATQGKLTGYATSMNTYLHCLSDEIKSGKDEYDDVSAAWKKSSEDYKNTPAK
jgi:hypothetical protein